MFTGGTFAGRMVEPFKAFKRQQHSAATGLLVLVKVNIYRVTQETGFLGTF